jgi:hypothetical protein
MFIRHNIAEHQDFDLDAELPFSGIAGSLEDRYNYDKIILN